MYTWDNVIVGGGLAGTALAWQLRWRGSRVLLLDRGTARTASRVAAGLLTPITGQRLVKTWRWDALWPAAVRFYRQIEEETGARFFHLCRTAWLFANQRERDFFHKRTELAEMIEYPDRLVEESSFANPLGGFEMNATGQLAVTDFLDASRERFFRDNGYRTAEIAPKADVELHDNAVSLPRLGIRTRRLIFCQGIDARQNLWFRGVPFDAAKGEILTVRIPGLRERRVVHHGMWLVPLGGDLFRAGSTYD